MTPINTCKLYNIYCVYAVEDGDCVGTMERCRGKIQ